MEMLRGALKGTPLVDLRTYLDDNPARTLVLERGTADDRNALADEVEAYLVASHHRPLLERQRRAKAEYDAVSMKMDPSMDYTTFQAEFRKCCNNLQRARLQKGIEDLKVDFLEKVPEECARYLMLTPYRDSVMGLMRPPATAEEVQAMAREYFAIQDSSRVQFIQEEVYAFGKAKGKGGKGKGKGRA